MATLIGPAMLIATLTVLNPGAPDTKVTNNSVLPETTQCSTAMMAYVEHYKFNNHLTTRTPTKVKGKKDNATLVITCEPLEK